MQDTCVLLHDLRHRPQPNVSTIFIGNLIAMWTGLRNPVAENPLDSGQMWQPGIGSTPKSFIF
jgi:hypothetical protein